MHSVAGVPQTIPKELQMRPTQKAAVALIAGAIIHAIGGIVGQIVQSSTKVERRHVQLPLDER
jgi:preprotein translocase subunit YajC